MATPGTICTITGAHRTYTLNDADTTLGTQRMQMSRFSVTDTLMTMYAGNKLPLTAQNVGRALQFFGKYVEEHEARGI